MVKASPLEERLGLLEGIIEKPQPKDDPSNLAVVGRYILTPRIIELLETTTRGAGDEIQLTDAIARLLMEEQVLAYQFSGMRYDCGDKLGYLEATVEFALRHPVLIERFADYLKGLTAQLNGTHCADGACRRAPSAGGAAPGFSLQSRHAILDGRTIHRQYAARAPATPARRDHQRGARQARGQ